VPIEFSALDQVGQRELSERRWHSSTHSLTVGDWLHEVLWEGQPAKANPSRSAHPGGPIFRCLLGPV